jgi:hypothetical protein
MFIHKHQSDVRWGGKHEVSRVVTATLPQKLKHIDAMVQRHLRISVQEIRELLQKLSVIGKTKR